MLYLTLLEMSSCCRQGMCMKIVCLVHHQYSKTRTHSSMPLVLSVFFFFWSVSLHPPAAMLLPVGMGTN